MAVVPSSGTNIRFLSGIPFYQDYKNQRWFDTQSEQTTYFTNKNRVHTMTQANFQRIEGYHYIKVNKSIEDLRGTNYVMFQNESYSTKWFYAFVTQLEYLQRNTTKVYFQIDVFQTWWFDISFKPSFVLREHCDLWNDDGSPVINTVDEGLNYGTEYETVSVDNWLPYDNTYFMVICCKQPMHRNFNTGEDHTSDESYPRMNGVPQPLTTYIYPFHTDGSTPVVNVGSGYIASYNILDILRILYNNTNAANNIVSIYITDYIGENPVKAPDQDMLTFNDPTFKLVTVDDSLDNEVNLLFVNDVLTYQTQNKDFGNKYTGFRDTNESKLLMYPYTVTILDDFRGNRTVYKNEYIEDQSLNVTAKGSMGVSNHTSYSILNYLMDDSIEPTEKLETSQEHAMINNAPNDVPILTNYLSAYLQGHKNSLETQRASIMFNGAMNVAGSAIGGVASAVSRNPMGVVSGAVNMVQGYGNTLLQMQAIESKLQDIDNKPPQLAKMGSNTSFDYGNSYNGVYVIKKQITPEYQRKLEDFFNVFGYKKNEVKVPNFHTRNNWNYVQTASCVILGDLNNEDLIELKSVFDNGVTLWHTDDVGNYDLENGVR